MLVVRTPPLPAFRPMLHHMCTCLDLYGLFLMVSDSYWRGQVGDGDVIPSALLLENAVA